MRGGWWETGDQTWLEIAGKIRRNEDLKKCKLFYSGAKSVKVRNMVHLRGIQVTNHEDWDLSLG
jgi:hypothetical protein